MQPHWSMQDPLECPIAATIRMLSGKWKPMIIHLLCDQPLHFNQLRRRIPPVTHKMLTQQLRELEHDGLVCRTVFEQVPPRVQYALTERGASLRGLINDLYVWGSTHIVPDPRDNHTQIAQPVA